MRSQGQKLFTTWPYLALSWGHPPPHTHELIKFSPWPMREASQCPHFTEKRLEPQGGECLT